MGWLVGWHSRKELIEHRTKVEEYKGRKWVTLAHCCRGNVLYRVQQIVDAITGDEITRYIAIDLLQRFKSEDNPQGAWGYKDLDEGCGPNAVTCPPKYFDLCPLELTGKDMTSTWVERAKAWREDCMKRHRQTHNREAISKYAKGDRFKTSRVWTFWEQEMNEFEFRQQNGRKAQVILYGRRLDGTWFYGLCVRLDTFNRMIEGATSADQKAEAV